MDYVDKDLLFFLTHMNQQHAYSVVFEKWYIYTWKMEFLPQQIIFTNTILLTFWLIIGTLGKATVIFVYQRGLKNNGQGRFFIPILATVDLMCVSVSATFNIVQITRRVTFPDSWICQLFFLLNSGDFDWLNAYLWQWLLLADFNIFAIS